MLITSVAADEPDVMRVVASMALEGKDSLRIITLGRLSVERDGEAVTDFASRKAEALLVYLACTGREHPREVLAELLWDERTQRQAMANLRVVLSSLRKAVGPFVSITRTTASISHESGFWLDVAQLEQAIAEIVEQGGLRAATAEALIEAMALYEGDFLAGFFLPGAGGFEAWAAGERQRLHRLAVDALQRLGRWHLKHGDYPATIVSATRLVNIDPLVETGHRQLMEALVRHGQRAGALAQYRKCTEILAEELGMAPSRRTTEMYEQIVAGDLDFDGSPRPDVRGYKLKEQIGEGAYGTIHRAVQPAVRREVAVKIVRRKYADDPDFIRSFEAEAQTIARLEHPYIVPLYDYWRDPDGAYLVMRYMAGGSLLAELEEGPWDGERAAAMVEQIASALAIAHRQGVVHRAIKPANILLDEAGNAYLADFRIARELLGERQLTAAGTVVATFDYISPEQITGDEVSPQADIYSLGAVLYETLTGAKPFGDATVARLLHSHLHEPIPLVTATRPDVPPELDAVLRKATAKNPADRYATAQEMAAAFRGAVGGAKVEAVASMRESRPAIVEIYNPYKGLHAFQESDADDFFGREALVRQLVERLGAKSDGQEKRSLDSHGTRFLALVGPSGSGKSSVVKAGLIPALRQGALPGSGKWFITEMVPGTNPLAELELALYHVAVDPPPDLVAPMRRDSEGILRTIRRILPHEPAGPRDGPQLLLLVDQFEELFTQVEEEAERAFFLDSLLAAMEAPHSPLRVVVTLRADFYDRPLHYQKWGHLVKENTEIVLPLDGTDLTLAIREPARRMGVHLEEGLASAIVADVIDQPGALPLLQYAMTELFERLEGDLLTRAAYEQLGGVQGALGRRAEALYADLDEASREIARQLFLRLVTLGEGVEDTRRRVLRSELEGLTNAGPADEVVAPPVTKARVASVLDRYGAARLLTFDRDPLTRAPTVEVAHEALLREWSRLRRWLDRYRDDVHLQRRLAAAAAEWLQAGRGDGYLLRGSRLDRFDDWLKNANLALTSDEQAYLRASLDARRERQVAERERQQREAGLERRYLRQAGILLAAQAESELEAGFSDRAILLALEALENYPYTPQAEHVLGQAVSYNRALQQFAGHGKAVTTVDWSPDGARIATSSTDNTVRVWDTAAGEQLLVIELPQGITGNIYDWALTVKWTPDGSQLLTLTGDRFLLGSQDYNMILCDASTGEQIKMIELPNQAEPAAGEGMATHAEHYATSTAAAFAPASGRLATVTGDNKAIIWDAAFEKPALVLTGHQKGVNGVDWSPDERSLATASEDGTVRLWDAQSGEELLMLSGHEGAVNQVAWSPGGRQLASAGKDGAVRFWNALTGTLDRTFEVDGGIVWSLTWSADGRYLATGTNDAIVRLWEIDSGQVIAELRGHSNFVFHVAWSPIGNRLASAGAAGLSYVWDAAPSTAALRLPGQYWGELDWSSDSRYLALGGGDWLAGVEPDNLTVWDVTTGQLVAEKLGFREGWFNSHPHFSPDDTLLLIQGFRGPFVSIPVAEWEAKTFVVDAQTGENKKTFSLQGDGTFIRTAFWSPDGRRIAAGTSSGTLAIWDYQMGGLLVKTSCGNWIDHLSWSPGGERLAVLCLDITAEGFSNGRIEILNAATGETLRSLTDPDPTAINLSVTWSPDGTRLLSTGGNDEAGTQKNPVIIWDADTGEQLLAITRHTGHVWSASWSPDGRRIATGSTDDTTRIWDAETGAELLTLSTPNNVAATTAWSPDGLHLAVSTISVDGPGKAEVWRVWQSTDELIEYAYECCVFRELTSEELAQFGLPEGQD